MPAGHFAEINAELPTFQMYQTFRGLWHYARQCCDCVERWPLIRRVDCRGMRLRCSPEINTVPSSSPPPPGIAVRVVGLYGSLMLYASPISIDPVQSRRSDRPSDTATGIRCCYMTAVRNTGCFYLIGYTICFKQGRQLCSCFQITYSFSFVCCN